MSNLLEVQDLNIHFHTYSGTVQAVRGVSFSIKSGEAVAIVGESGCGKSVTAKSIMQLLPKQSTDYTKGSILFNGKNLIKKSEKEMRRIRGNEISMIFQDPMTSLNPTTKVGKQIMEVVLNHHPISKAEAYNRALEALKLVGIPQPEKRMQQYPHEFSGGMRQRAMIAMALVCDPQLLIADEPTTALDVTIQAQILALMKDIQRKLNTSIILITHDLGVVAETCERVIVMYAGQVVETGTVKEIFENPQNPYTKGLLNTVPRLTMPKSAPLVPIIGTPPDLMDPPEGCSFYPRCQQAMRVCKNHKPTLEEISDGHLASCWLHHPMAWKMRGTS